MEYLAVQLVLGFAAYRVTQLVVWDTILDGWRERLELWHARRFDSRIRTFVRDLLKCTYCFGYWASVATVLTYLLATGHNPVGSADEFWLFGIQSFSVAGIQALLSRWDDTRPGHQD